MNEISMNLLKATIALIFIVLVDFGIEYCLIKKIKDKKRSIKLRVLLRYVLFFCLIFFMAKIWVEGFGYLLTTVGVIAAALTITQKEYLMNLVGWLIIMWRDLFVEGDYIEIGKYAGYVHHIRPLYFSIHEASDIWGEKTGRIIKIPNSVIAHAPVLKFSTDSALVEAKIAFIFGFQSSLEKIQALILNLEKDLEKSMKSVLKGRAKPRFLLRVFQEKPSGIQLTVRYFSFKGDQQAIETYLTLQVIQAVQTDPQSLVFSVAT